MANKITTLLELDPSKWTQGLKSVKKSITDAEGAIGKLKAGWSGAMESFRRHSTTAAVAGGAAFTAFAAKAIGEASDLEESINAVNVTFGDAAQSVLAIGENSAKSFGLAKSEFNQLAVQMSSFAKNVASQTGQPVAQVLEDLTTRIADFASVMNLDLSEAVQVFQSTLAGETEPIRRFGKDISAAAVEAFALSEGLVENKKDLTEAIKVQARYGLLMEQTADTTGDFANTADGMANSQRILQAEFKDTAARVGQDLQPVLLELLQLTQRLLDTGEKLHLDEIFGIPNDIINKAEELGRSFRRMGDMFGGEEFRRNWDIIEAFEDSEAAAADFDRALLKNANSVADVRKIVIDYTGDQTAANMVAVEWAKANDLAAGQTIKEKEALEEEREALLRTYDAGQAYVELLEGRYYSALADITEAINRARQANKLYADSQREAREEVLNSLSTMFDYEKATMDTAAAVEALTAAAEAEDATMTSVREAQIAAAESALSTAQAFAESKGALDGSTLSAQLQLDELNRLAGKFPELLPLIQGYIDKLNSIPSVKSTTLVVTTSGKVTTKQTRNADGRLVAGATGAIVRQPTIALIGEAGPEAVVPLNRTPGNSPLPTGMGGGMNVTIHVQTMPTPRQLKDMLAKYERFNGPGL